MDSAKSQACTRRTGTIDPERWVEEHGDCLYRYALLRVRRPEVAEDLVQEEEHTSQNFWFIPGKIVRTKLALRNLEE